MEEPFRGCVMTSNLGIGHLSWYFNKLAKITYSKRDSRNHIYPNSNNELVNKEALIAWEHSSRYRNDLLR